MEATFPKQTLRSMQFVVKRQAGSNELGWVPIDKPWFDVSSKDFLCHDVFEEFPGGCDQPHDEFQALGAYLWGRGRMRYMGLTREAQSFTHVVMPVNAIMECFRHAFSDHSDDDYLRDDQVDRSFKLIPAPAIKASKNIWLEGVLDEIMTQVQEWLMRALEKDEDRRCDYWQTDEAINECLEYLVHLRNWIRIGWRRAQKRYANIDPWEVVLMFQSLEKQTSALLPQAEVGDVLRVNVNLRDYTVQADVVYN